MPEGRDVDGGAAAADLLSTRLTSNTGSRRVGRDKDMASSTVRVMANRTPKTRASMAADAALAKSVLVGARAAAGVLGSTSHSVASIPLPWTIATAPYWVTTTATCTRSTAVAGSRWGMANLQFHQ